jgi:hypothetical protein
MLATSTALASSVCAQTVRGIVVARDLPVPGVVVQLVDSSSAVVARALSNDRGEFRITAATGGSYRLRTLRIGYAPSLSPVVVLRAGTEVSQRIALSNILIALDTVRVTDRSSCRAFSDSAAATFAVWEQVRTALTAAQLTASARAIAATTVAYERSLDPSGRRVLNQSMHVSSDYVTQPWRTIAPERLRRDGYVVTDQDNTVTYDAPGLDMLLSPGFLEDHCFRLEAKADRLGVRFEPIPERKSIAEVRGTIWLDRKSAELRSMEYRYANISPEQADEARGNTEFVRLRNGAWVIAKWDIRMPRLENRIGPRSLGASGIRVTGIEVSGGELSLVRRASDTLWSRPSLAMTGEIVDSASGRPWPNASIELVGAMQRAVADSRGRFTIANVLPGQYTAQVRTESLDSVRAVFQTPIEFADATTRIELRVPTAQQLSASVCRGQTMTDVGIILGDVEVANDTLLTPMVTVVAEWEQPTVQRDASGVVSVGHPKRHVETRADKQGVFRLCGVPANTTVWLRASADGVFGDYVAVQIPAGGRFTRASLTVDHNAPNLATLSGVVVTDSTSVPIANAEDAIADLAKVTLTDARGAFKLTGIPAGAYTLTARHIGYGPLEARITIAAAEAVERRLLLSRVVMLDSVIVRAEATDLRMRDFEDNRKLGLGHFLMRDQIEKLSGISMGALMSQFNGTDIVHDKYSSYLASSRWKSRCNPLDGDCLEREKLYTLGPRGWSCFALVYLDNVLMNRGRPAEMFDLRTVHQSQIEAIEYYEGSVTTPSKYNSPGSQCGVLVIHTRYGD